MRWTIMTLALLSITGCGAPKTFGVSQDKWLAMTPEQQLPIIEQHTKTMTTDSIQQVQQLSTSYDPHHVAQSAPSSAKPQRPDN